MKYEQLSVNFNRREFACKGKHCCNHSAPINPALILALESLRAVDDKPITINSAYRCHAHNNAPVEAGGVGSYAGSQHPRGNAADIAWDGRDRIEWESEARKRFSFVKVYSWGMHCDVR
jgi:uncharacterized protein YcbK (DUF882 family)